MKKTIKRDYKKLAEKNLAAWQRAQADLENFRKRSIKEKQDFLQFANADLVSQVLPVLDNFSEAMKHVPEDKTNEPWLVGVSYIKKQLEDVLEKNGVEEIKVKAGAKFDPSMMEAVGGKAKKNKIKKIMRQGYKLNNRILRVVQVEVE